MGELYVLADNSGRRFGRATRGVPVEPIHDLHPTGSRTRNARYVPHGRSRKVASPNPNRVTARVADAPVVAHILAGPGLYGGPVASGQRTLQLECRAPTLPIREDVRDQESRLGGESGFRWF